MAKKTKKQEPKVKVSTWPVTGKTLHMVKDGEVVGDIVKVSEKISKGTKPVNTYLTMRHDTNKNPLNTLRVHTDKDEAIARFSRRFPKLSPTLRKRL